MKRAIERLLLVFASIAAGVLASACGGGSPSRAIEEQGNASVPAARGLQRAASVDQITPASLFEWAQRAYPQFFYGPTSDGTLLTYSYRYYAWPGTYLAVSDGNVFLYGSITSHQLIQVAPLSAFRCNLLPPSSCVEEWKSQALGALNRARELAGLPQVQLQTSLGVSAQAHSDYVEANYFPNGIADPIAYQVQPDGILNGHKEMVGRSGFTGTTWTERAGLAGYSTNAYDVGEVITNFYSGLPYSEPDMSACIMSLVGSVYHRAGLFGSDMEHVGIGISAFQADANNYRHRTCVLNTGSRKLGVTNVVSPRWYGFFPADGQQLVPVSMGPEAPDPAPSISVKGYPVSVQVHRTLTLNPSSFRLVDIGGTTVPTVLLTHATSAYLSPSEAYLLPIGALLRATTYTATFSGTASSGATEFRIERSWSFTTEP